MAFLNPYRWILAIALIGALVLGYFAWEKNIRSDERAKVVTEYNVKIAKQKADAIELYFSESAKVTAAEKAMRDAKDKQENDDAVNTKAISLLADKLRSTRLRDPNGAGCGQSSGAAQSGNPSGASLSPNNGAEGGGLLSESLSRLLLSQAETADNINNAYISCRADAKMIRATLAQ